MNIMGCTVAPTIKVTANPRTAARLADNVDVDVSAMLAGETLQQAGGRLYGFAKEVCEGTLTSAEIFGDEDIAISRLQPTV
jgi:altronate dehydratase large subunit